jgi:RNA polymerase sigma-70 factor (ECF subfamily)
MRTAYIDPMPDTAPATELREAQDRFVQENLRRVFLLVYRIVGNVADAQDLTQETFIKALQRRDQLKDLEKSAHWLSRIATNTAIDYLRRHGRVAFSAIEDVAEPLVDRTQIDPEERILRAEKKAFLDRGLECLTVRERAALLLRDVEDLPAEEVAARLNCSKATVRSHIATARNKFRTYLAGRRDG